MKRKEDKQVKEKEDINRALMKKALGYTAEETVEEYSMKEDGEVLLSKKKVTKKNVPPDITALKILLESKEPELNEMTDEQLEQEKIRLLKILREIEKA
ncbi:MAG: hypothetical protein IJY57_04995 [Clostridia bacterium]|nr:hypothetical protein [Clostridia bacterium]